MGRLKIVADIHVRMGSSRLPGKVMMEILGKPVLHHIVDRVRRSKYVDEVVVATSVTPENDVIEEYCKKNGIACFRGSEDDVLDRVLNALTAHGADVGVDIFGDEPLLDVGILDSLIQFYLDYRGEYDWVGNDLKTTFPPGTEAEVYSVAALRDSANRTNDIAIREHCTLFIRQHPELYRIKNIEAPPDLYYPEMEIELDTAEDFEVIKTVYEHLYPKNPAFDIRDIIAFMAGNEQVQELNRHVPRRWKEFRKE